MRKRVGIVQSNYIPWKGYFDLIHDVDLFIFRDDVQFTKGDWRNRNRIKTPSGSCWLTVPVSGDNHRPIHEVKLADPTWGRRHWNRLFEHYGRTPYFKRYRGYFEHVYLETVWASLSELNQTLIRHIARDFLGIATEFHDSRRYDVRGRRFDRLFSLVEQSGAGAYISGPAAKVYIEPARFAAADIELHWKDYSGYPEYPQRFPPFVHEVTILDLLFNVGPDAPACIWGWRDGRT